jgi:hypothetical protein
LIILLKVKAADGQLWNVAGVLGDEAFGEDAGSTSTALLMKDGAKLQSVKIVEEQDEYVGNDPPKR